MLDEVGRDAGEVGEAYDHRRGTDSDYHMADAARQMSKEAL